MQTARAVGPYAIKGGINILSRETLVYFDHSLKYNFPCQIAAREVNAVSCDALLTLKLHGVRCFTPLQGCNVGKKFLVSSAGHRRQLLIYGLVSWGSKN